MNRPSMSFLVPLIIFISLAIFLGIGLTLNPKELPSAFINKPAPEFELAILSESLNLELAKSGDNTKQITFTPSQLKGKRWILNVWASWCAACRQEHPLFNELAEKTNITIVGLNYKDTVANATQWLEQRGNPYDYVPLDLKGDVGIDWGVYGVPETFVIDENGIILLKHVGPVTGAVLNETILPLFNDSPL